MAGISRSSARHRVARDALQSVGQRRRGQDAVAHDEEFAGSRTRKASRLVQHDGLNIAVLFASSLARIEFM